MSCKIFGRWRFNYFRCPFDQILNEPQCFVLLLTNGTTPYLREPRKQEQHNEIGLYILVMCQKEIYSKNITPVVVSCLFCELWIYWQNTIRKLLVVDYTHLPNNVTATCHRGNISTISKVHEYIYHVENKLQRYVSDMFKYWVSLLLDANCLHTVI